MPQLEFVVRPVQAPLIRPSPGAPKAAEPEEKVTEINGGSVQELQLRASYSKSVTHSRSSKEKERVVDLVRVKNPEDENQYIDMQVAHRLTLKGSPTATQRMRLKPPAEAENVEILQRNITVKSS